LYSKTGADDETSRGRHCVARRHDHLVRLEIVHQRRFAVGPEYDEAVERRRQPFLQRRLEARGVDAILLVKRRGDGRKDA